MFRTACLVATAKSDTNAVRTLSPHFCQTLLSFTQSRLHLGFQKWSLPFKFL